MDPNANARDRVALLSARSWTCSDLVRYRELDRAYRDWIATGGFSADAELRAQVEALRHGHTAGRSSLQVKT